MTLPAQLRRGHSPGDILDGHGRLFASIHPGQAGVPGRAGIADLADAVVERWNTRLSLIFECARLERIAKNEAAARARAETERDEAQAALAAALGAQGTLKELIGKDA